MFRGILRSFLIVLGLLTQLMSETQVNSTSQKQAESDLPRPVLIVSRETISEYSMFLERLLVGLAGESIQVMLICPPDCDVGSVTFGITEVVRYPSIELPFWGRYYRSRLVQQLEKFRPTVLHCLCQKRAAFTRRLARQLNLPYVLTVNSLQKRRRQLSISSNRCRAITAPAANITANVAQFHPRFSDRIEQVNIAALVSEKSNCFSETGRLASIVTPGPLKKDNRFENVLEVVKRLAIEGHEFLLVVTDSGPAKKQLRRSISARGLSRIVVRVPLIRPCRLVLGAADIFIRAAVSTSFEPLMLEAMSLGTAVAACRGGVDDLIIEGQTAAVFDPNDEFSLYKCLQDLLNRREEACKLAAGAQQYLRENYSLGGMTSSFLRIYREARETFKG